MTQQLIGGKFSATYPDAITGALKPAVGYKLYTYISGTVTNKTTWSDSALTAPNTNPIVLDARGEASVFLGSGPYTVVLKSASGSTIWSRDGIATPNDYTDALRADLAASSGASLLGFIGAEAGSVATTAQDALRESVNVFRFMTSAQKADVISRTGALDLTAAFNAALAVNGSIRLPVPGVYYVASPLALPGGFTALAIQGSTNVDNYYERSNATVVKTGGASFMVGGSTSLLFCAKDVFFRSANQTGTCFGTTSATETGFAFDNVGFQYFDAAFFAPQYASSCYGVRVSCSDCHKGLYSTLDSNNTAVNTLGLNRCVIGARLWGSPVLINGGQISLGYSGADAASFAQYVGFDAQLGSVTFTNVYHENYGLDYSKNVLYSLRSSTSGDDHYAINGPLSSLANLKHIQLYSENLANATKAGLVTVNGSVPGGCPTIIAGAGQTGLIRGVKVNGNGFSSNAASAVFDAYDVEAVITAGTALNTSVVTAFGTSNVTMVGFASTSITGFTNILNNANATVTTGRFYFPAPDYHHCPLGSFGATSGLFEISGELAIDGLAATKTYALGLVYKVPGGSYTIKQIGDFKALAVAGGALFNFSATFKTNARLATGSSVGVCFIPSSTVDVPAAGDITGSLYGKIRVRWLSD